MRKISSFKKFNEAKLRTYRPDEKSPIWLNEDMWKILGYISNCSANRLASFFGGFTDNQHIITPANYLKPGERNDEILFAPIRQLTDQERGSKVGMAFNKSNNPIKVGRLVRKLYNDNNPDKEPITDKEVEHFVNLYKESWERIKGVNQNFKVVYGEDIRYWYYQYNYCMSTIRGFGTLGKSCMMGDDEQAFLDIYVKNPSVCGLVIQCNSENKLISRALIWKLKGNMGYYLDRIYYTDEYQTLSLKKWVTDNFDIHECYKGDNYRCDSNMKVQLKEWRFKLYPYMDSFRHLNYYTGELCPRSQEDRGPIGRTNPELHLYSTSGGHQCYGWKWSKIENQYIPSHIAIFDPESDSHKTRTVSKILPFHRFAYQY